MQKTKIFQVCTEIFKIFLFFSFTLSNICCSIFATRKINFKNKIAKMYNSIRDKKLKIVNENFRFSALKTSDINLDLREKDHPIIKWNIMLVKAFLGESIQKNKEYDEIFCIISKYIYLDNYFLFLVNKFSTIYKLKNKNLILNKFLQKNQNDLSYITNLLTTYSYCSLFLLKNKKGNIRYHNTRKLIIDFIKFKNSKIKFIDEVGDIKFTNFCINFKRSSYLSIKWEYNIDFKMNPKPSISGSHSNILKGIDNQFYRLYDHKNNSIGYELRKKMPFLKNSKLLISNKNNVLSFHFHIGDIRLEHLNKINLCSYDHRADIMLLMEGRSDIILKKYIQMLIIEKVRDIPTLIKLNQLLTNNLYLNNNTTNRRVINWAKDSLSNIKTEQNIKNYYLGILSNKLTEKNKMQIFTNIYEKHHVDEYYIVNSLINVYYNRSSTIIKPKKFTILEKYLCFIQSYMNKELVYSLAVRVKKILINIGDNFFYFRWGYCISLSDIKDHFYNSKLFQKKHTLYPIRHNKDIIVKWSNRYLFIELADKIIIWSLMNIRLKSQNASHPFLRLLLLGRSDIILRDILENVCDRLKDEFEEYSLDRYKIEFLKDCLKQEVEDENYRKMNKILSLSCKIPNLKKHKVAILNYWIREKIRDRIFPQYLRNIILGYYQFRICSDKSCNYINENIDIATCIRCKIPFDFVFSLKNLNSYDCSQDIKSLSYLDKGRFASNDLGKHKSCVYCLTYIGDGIFATCSRDMTIKLWQIDYNDPKNTKCIATLKGHKCSITSLSYLGKGLLASGSWDKTIKIWKIDYNPSKNTKCVHTLFEHQDTVKCLSYMGNCLLASGSSDNTIRLWLIDHDTPKTTMLVHTLVGHQDTINCLSFLDKGFLASGSSDSKIKLWQIDFNNLKNTKCVKTLFGHDNRINCFSFLDKGLLASSSGDRTIKIWRIDYNNPKNTINIAMHKFHNDSVVSLSYLGNGLLAFYSGNDTTIRLWQIDYVNPQKIKSIYIHKWPESYVSCISYIGKGLVAIGSFYLPYIRIWKIPEQYNL